MKRLKDISDSDLKEAMDAFFKYCKILDIENTKTRFFKKDNGYSVVTREVGERLVKAGYLKYENKTLDKKESRILEKVDNEIRTI